MVIGTGTRRRAHFGPSVRVTNPLIVFPVLLLIGIVLGVVAAFVWNAQARFAAEGVPAQAVIVDMDTQLRRTRDDIRRDHTVAYEFTVDSQTVAGSSSVTEQHYNALKVGDSLDVVYLPNEPHNNILAANNNMTMPYIVAGFAVLWNVIALGYGGLKLVAPLMFRRGA